MTKSSCKYNAENSVSLKVSDPQPSHIKSTRIFTSCPKLVLNAVPQDVIEQYRRFGYEQLTVAWLMVKVKVKLSRYRPDVAQRVGRVIALHFHDGGTRRGWVVSSMPRPHFTPGKGPVPIVQEAGWVPGPVWTGGKSRPHRDSIPDRLARSSVAIPNELPGPLPD